MSKESPLQGVQSSVARTRSERLGRLVVSGLLTLPLLAELIAELLGFELFYLADPKLQAVWGTLAQFVGGWALYGLAFRHLRQGGGGRALWLSLISSLVYLISLYLAFVRPGTGVLFLGSASLIFAAYLVDYLEVRRIR